MKENKYPSSNNKRHRVDERKRGNRNIVHEDESEMPLKKKLELKKEKKKRRKRKRILVAIRIILLLILVFFIGAIYFLSGLKSKTMPKAITPGFGDSVNILVLGMDIGDIDNTANENARRTDTMMVFNYNPSSNEANIISVPRDTLINVQGENWKINAAYAIGGEDEVINQVEGLLQTDINYVVKIDYSGFRDLVDAIGGVDMYIEQDMYYDDDAQNLHINFTAGETVHLDGQKAEEFFRWRQNSDGSGLANGDLDRIKNQQKLVEKIMEKCSSPLVVFKLPSILGAISNNVETNMGALRLIRYGFAGITLDSDNLKMHTLKGEPQDIDGQSYLVSDPSMNTELINIINYGNSATTIDKSNISIMVLNGTKVNGLAGDVQGRLNDLGYTNVEIGNSEVISKSVIQSSNKDAREILKRELGIKKQDKYPLDEYANYDVVIILGQDYDIYQ